MPAERVPLRARLRVGRLHPLTPLEPGPLILGASRTPFALQGGGLAQVEVGQLAAAVIAAVLTEAGVARETLDGVVVATDYHASDALRWLAPALPEVPLLGIACGGHSAGLAALGMAARALGAGTARFVLVVGCDSSSTAPHFLPGSTRGAKLGHGTLSSIVSATAGAEPEGLPECDAMISVPGVVVDAGSRKAPKPIAADEVAASRGPGDGAAAVLLGADGDGMAALASVRIASSARVLLTQGSRNWVCPHPQLPAPPGAIALAALIEGLARLEAARQVTVIAGQPPYGYAVAALEAAGRAR